MDIVEKLLLALAACGGLYTLIAEIYKTKAKRKAELEDRAEAKAEKRDELAENVAQLTIQMQELQAYVKENMAALNAGLTAVNEAEKQDLKDRITRYCKGMIQAGEVDWDDYENIKTLHDAYERLGGNGDIDDLMERVKRLPITDSYGRKNQ